MKSKILELTYYKPESTNFYIQTKKLTSWKLMQIYLLTFQCQIPLCNSEKWGICIHKLGGRLGQCSRRELPAQGSGAAVCRLGTWASPAAFLPHLPAEPPRPSLRRGLRWQCGEVCHEHFLLWGEYSILIKCNLFWMYPSLLPMQTQNKWKIWQKFALAQLSSV